MKHFNWRGGWGICRWCHPTPSAWPRGHMTGFYIVAAMKLNGSFAGSRLTGGSSRASTNWTFSLSASLSSPSFLKPYAVVLTRPSPLRTPMRDTIARAKKENNKLFVKANTAWDKGDLRRAFELFSCAAKSGDSSCQLDLGYFFDRGLHVKKDKKKAMHWYY